MSDIARIHVLIWLFCMVVLASLHIISSPQEEENVLRMAICNHYECDSEQMLDIMNMV
jgi:hypothetical protein